MSATFLFTYGTLRPGGTLSDVTPGQHVGRGVVSGKLHRHDRARFPVLLHDDDNDVVGDVFRIRTRESQTLDFVLDMEVGAGYDTRIRPVTLTELAHPFSSYTRGDTVPAIVFVWPDRFPIGPRIYCGDWFSPEAADVCSDLNAYEGFTDRRLTT